MKWKTKKAQSAKAVDKKRGRRRLEGIKRREEIRLGLRPDMYGHWRAPAERRMRW